ncbi:MAG: WbqC family protein, partial [Paludibacteraceae bacterium]|nr:WbqC family protein [Paludibacteraceae bacterium]
QKTLELLNFSKIEFSLSNSYIETSKFNTKDLREVINPKKFNVTLYKNLSTPYYQIFDQKFGFTPNLSIIDLLFNMGNEARIYLKDLMPIN